MSQAALSKPLASRGFLDQVGQKRGTSYRLPNWASSFAMGASPLAANASPLASGASSLVPGASPLAADASPLATDATETDPRLLEIAKPARDKKKLIPVLTKQIIHQLCTGHYLTADQIGALMDRGKDKLQQNFLAVMVADGELTLRFPEQPTHPDQAYQTKERT